MIEATQLKNGTTFLMDKKPYRVIKYEHQKIGRGGATVKLKLRNLENGKQEERALNSSHKVDEINTTKRPLQYLFSDGGIASFMDQVSFEQYNIPISLIKNDAVFLKEGEVVNVLFWQKNDIEEPLSIEISPRAKLKVVDTPPGVKGNSASNSYKQAQLENGISIKVPLFIKNGETIVVDTRTSEYVERAKN